MGRQGKTKISARILKAHSHSMSGGSIWASLECHCCFWIVGGLVSYLTMWLLALQIFKNSIDTQEKVRLNLHSLSVSELLEYGRRAQCELPRVRFWSLGIWFVWGPVWATNKWGQMAPNLYVKIFVVLSSVECNLGFFPIGVNSSAEKCFRVFQLGIEPQVPGLTYVSRSGDPSSSM
jgi:hypothetical protein